MKTALFLTDCSIDSARTLGNWMTQYEAERIRLTIVHPYELSGKSPITKEIHQVAKQQAQSRLAHWSEMLPPSPPGMMLAETLFGGTNLTFTIYLYLRRYTYVLLNSWQDTLPALYASRAAPESQLLYIDSLGKSPASLVQAPAARNQAVPIALA